MNKSCILNFLNEFREPFDQVVFQLQEKNTPLFHQLSERMDVPLDVEVGPDAMTNTSMFSINK